MPGIEDEGRNFRYNWFLLGCRVRIADFPILSVSAFLLERWVAASEVQMQKALLLA